MKLQDIHTIYISPNIGKYVERKEYTEALLTKIGVKSFEHYQSSTEKYPDCLRKAQLEILKNNLNRPFLWLEDDVEITDPFLEIDVPEDADAIYLGVSLCIVFL
jgi:hypothetical protein